MKRFGPKELMAHVIGNNLCIGCGACQELCPYFRSYRGRTAMLFPCTKPEGRCFAYCPKVEIDLDELSWFSFGEAYSGEPLGHRLSIAMSRAGERAGKAPFQSGGTVSALVQFALEKKLIDSAVLTAKEGMASVPIIAESPEEVLSCASSKYAAAPTLAALNRALKEGMRRIGVVSTPCQSLAVAKMRANAHAEGGSDESVGLVIGLFCTWSLDFRSFHAFLEGRLDTETIRKIDIPPPPGRSHGGHNRRRQDGISSGGDPRTRP
jgi:coenzyme F420 hydrogenase subunit beta